MREPAHAEVVDEQEWDGGDVREVALARARRPQEEPVLVLGDEAAGGELEDEASIHLLVELEVKGVERLAPVAEAGLCHPAIEEPVLTALELVLHERGEEIDGGELLRLGLQQPGLEAGGHAGAAELAQGAVQFDEVHVGISSWALRAMRSR